LTEDIVNRLNEDERVDPLELYALKTLLNEGTSELPGVKRRFLESKDNYQTVMNFIQKEKLEEAEKSARIYAANGKGHPIFLDLAQELK